MTELVVIGAAALLIVGLCVLSGYLGAEKERRRQAERIAREKIRDAEIGAHPPVDFPFGGMRPKE
jgi:hypothetical protein